MSKTWKLIVWPTVVMCLFLAIILVSSQGAPLTYRAPMLELLAESADEATSAEATTVVMFLPQDADTPAVETVQDTLTAVMLPYQSLGADTLPALNGVTTLLYCSQDLTPLAQSALALNEWVNAGGRLALMITPYSNAALNVFAGKLGVAEQSGDYIEYQTVRFLDDDFALWDNAQVYSADGALSDYALMVRLDDGCVVHMASGDAVGVPLLWTRDVGAGRVAVSNNSLISGKDSRGFALQVLLAVQEPFAYPIVNAGLVFIDDFPAPQPEGFNARLRAQYGYDTQGFYRNHWWPDMKQLTWDDGVRYTGVLVETYNDNVDGPFDPDTQDRSLIRYYASELLQSGGEIGLHGYNHMPLCLAGFPYAGEDYKTWPSVENMAAAATELLRYGSSFLPSAMFRAYVPPSNYLSEEGQATLLQTVPQVRTISGVYLPETGVHALTQEFREEADGSVSVPRITSGFAVDEYNVFVAAEELLLHGVFSHFIHPDDVLDVERGAELGWDEMYKRFSAFIGRIEAVYPALRWSTASEGSAAVQRYNRLRVRTEADDTGLTLRLSSFYDEAWVAVKTERPLSEVEGTVVRISDSLYWVYAQSDEVRLAWEVEP